MMRLRLFVAVNLLCLTASAQVNVLTYHNDNARTGANLDEVILTPVNVRSNTFGKLFTYNVDGYVYAQPLYVSGLAFSGATTHNVIFVATEHNTVYAFDADSNAGANGGLLWQTNLGPSAAVPNADFGNRDGGFTAIVPEVGITATPVIDLTNGNIYVNAFTHEGANYFHKLHALNLTNGAERSFSPVTVGANIAGNGVGGSGGVVTFDAKQQINRAALTLAGGRIYLAFAGYDDTNPYHGWVIGYNASNLQALPNYVFNTTPNSSVASSGADAGEGGIWLAGCGLSADSAGSLYVGVGNGIFNALNNSGGTEYGNSFIRLSTTSGLAVADYFTPYNQAFLSTNDLDVASGGIMLLPDQPGPTPHLMCGGGKNGRLYIMNRDQMTTGNNHYNNGGSDDDNVQTVAFNAGIFDSPAYFDGRVYCSANSDVLAGFSVVNGLFDTANISVSSRHFNYPPPTPAVSASGNSNGIVWVQQMGNPGILIAYNATNLASELYNSTQVPARDSLTNGVKFAVPTIANGKVYMGGKYAVSVYGLLGSPLGNWKTNHFGVNANNAAISGNTADPDNDKIQNLSEYAAASDPNTANSPRLTGSLVSNKFQLKFSRNLFATDLKYTAQRTSAAIGPWTNLATFATNTWTTNLSGIGLSEAAATGMSPDQRVPVTLWDMSFTSNRFLYRLLVQ